MIKGVVPLARRCLRITKTVEATYEDGVLTLDEPVDLAGKSRVRVQIEIPLPDDDLPESGAEPRRLALSSERRELLQRVRTLRDKIPRMDFDIVEALREIREHG
jgi:predicted DNA-binding antitoxin AbrB/MazE fold protein